MTAAEQLQAALGSRGKFHLYSPSPALNPDQWAIDVFPILTHRGHTVRASTSLEVYQAAHDWLDWWRRSGPTGRPNPT